MQQAALRSAEASAIGIPFQLAPGLASADARPP
jgi:hypothetical protein